MTDDIDDLIGPDPDTADDDGPISLDLGAVHGGVSVSWLGKVFAIHPQDVKKRLADCPPIRGAWGNKPVFNLKQAAGYLVAPKVNIAEWIKKLRPNDLPVHLQAEFWNAQRSKQKWEEDAGDLWRTEAVRDVLADAFKRIKEGMQLWVDGLERAEHLTSVQRERLVAMVDALQDDLHERLVAMPKERKTGSMIIEVDGNTGEKE